MWLLLFIFVLNIIAVQMLLGPKAIESQGLGVLFYFGQQFAGSWASYVMIFAVLSSTVATTQTTLLPAARISYSMARDGVFPKAFASIHPKTLTPAVGTITLAFISLFGIMLTSFSSSSGHVFNNLVNNIGVLVAFYYGITGLGCASALRKTIGQNFRKNVTMVYLPFIGGVVLLYVCYKVMAAGGRSSIPDITVFALGIPLLFIAWVRARGKSGFFTQPLVSYDTVEHYPKLLSRGSIVELVLMDEFGHAVLQRDAERSLRRARYLPKRSVFAYLVHARRPTTRYSTFTGGGRFESM